MRFKLIQKLLILLPILFTSLLATGQNTTFTYLFDDGFGSPCAPSSVNFYPTTTLTNPTYTWMVNGVTFSSQEEPIRVFPVGGNYNICLEVSNGAGTIESHCETVVIVDLPTVTLTNDVAIGCTPLVVNFTLNSTSNIDSVVWDFGDGTVINQNGNDSTEMVYEHTYLTGGSFTPIVTAFGENGCKVTVSNPNSVETVNTPAPSFSADQSIGCVVPHTVNFSNNTAMSPDLEFYWDFGVDANSNSTDVNPSFTYNALGSYDVMLVVSNINTGCADTLLIENFINIGEFDGFQYDIIDNGDCSSTEVAFSFYDSGNIQSVSWDFGDGNSSTLINPMHTYTQAGCYTPSLSITTTDGCSYNTTASECIGAAGPVTIGYTTSGDLSTCDEVNGTTVSFTSNTPQAEAWHWDFGGLDSSFVENPTFTFTGYGTYPVTLTVTYPGGCTESITEATVQISELQAEFSSNVVDGCEELQVFFFHETNEIDPITSYEWNFGGGSGLTNIENPVVIFADTGSYDISLIIETISGCTDTLIMEDYIEVGMPSVPEFSADPLISCLEDEIQFTSESGPLVDSWEWHFGDGGQSGEEDPMHEYQDTGYFDVMLITYFHGCPDTIVKEEYVYIDAPKADFSFDQDCTSPGEIQFNDLSAGAESWQWDFGDGNSSTLPNPAHTYSANGSYFVTLSVSNTTTGCTHTQSMMVNVTSSVPEFTLSDLNICVGDTISVINSSVGADCYTWTFPFGVGMITNSFCDEDPQFYFPSAGTYQGFSLTISDGSNCMGTYHFPGTVYVSGSVSDFTTTDTEGCVPHTANFTNSAFGINGNITNYSWDFGDGNSSTDANPTHTYDTSGIFTVSLLVENDSGCTDQLVMENLIEVDEIEPFFIPQVSDCSSQAVNFTNASTSFKNDMTFLWDFGGGNTSTETNPSYAFPTTGDHTVCLTATSSNGCSAQFCEVITFEPIIAEFTADQTFKSCPEPPLVTTFEDLSTNAVTWFWDFGDGANSGLQNPSHSYNETGLYTVCLTVTNTLGCTTTECKTDYIEVDGPKGTLTITPTEGCADLEVQFIIESENAYRYKWDFGDGVVVDSLASGDSDTITHVYKDGGTFYPVVLVEDISGCEIPVIGDPIVVENIITDFLATVNEVCEEGNTPIDFLIAFNIPGSITSVTWEFPGSSTPTATGLTPTGIVYNQPGYHDVIVTVNSTYCQTTVTKDSFIYVYPSPTIDFTFTPTDICDEGNVFFLDASFSTSDANFPDDIVGWNWTVENTTYDEESFFHNFSAPGDYIVTLEATTEFGCIATGQQTVTIFESPNVDAGQNVFLCQNDVANLQATVQTAELVTYEWTPVDGLSCTDCIAPVAEPQVTTMYYVTATSANGCVSVDSVLVEVSSLDEPVVTITEDQTICQGESTDLLAEINHPASSYVWSTLSPGLSCYTCPDPIASPSDTTTYFVIVTTTEGCTATNSMTVNVIPDVDLIDGDPVICLGDDYQLEVTEGTDITWSPATGLSCVACPNPAASPETTTTYSVTSLIEGQCTMTDEITITVVTSDLISAGNDIEICEGLSATLTGNYPAGTSAWLHDGNVIATDSPTHTVTPSESGEYVLEVTTSGCVLTDTVYVDVIDKVEIFGENVVICEGDTAYLNVTGDAESYQWIINTDLSDPMSANPFAVPSQSTSYYVVGDFQGCKSDTLEIFVEVLPIADIQLEERIYFAEGETVQLNANVTNGSNFTYSWSPPLGLSCTDCPSPSVEPTEDIIYQVTVANDLGCLDTASVMLRKIFICNEDLIIVPNAFTPNGDGKNDRFNVISDLQIDMVKIYNRWGEVVFEDAGGKTGWDGTFKGQKLNRDVFIYHVEATCEFNGSKLVKTGDITLIR